jgi:hypothetical protein
MKASYLTPQEWDQYAEKAHLICFDEVMDADINRIDFALVIHEDDVPLSYTTCREFDKNTVYMQFGGAFPSAKNTLKSFFSYKVMLDTLSEKYMRATTLIENTNLPMIKFAMKAGFKIIGVRYYKGSILLEHLLEWR